MGPLAAARWPPFSFRITEASGPPSPEGPPGQAISGGVLKAEPARFGLSHP